MNCHGRIFTLEDQHRFCRLSGDYNPIHNDPVAARRLIFGDVVVHGVHLVLHALEGLLQSRPDFGSLERVKARFDNPVTVGDEVDCELMARPSGTIIATMRAGRKTAAVIEFSAGGEGVHPWRGAADYVHEPCEELNDEELSSAHGEMSLHLPAICNEMFPLASVRIPPHQIALLLATTRLVGMRCPGRHSIFAGLNIAFRGGAAREGHLRYEVRNFDPRFKMLEISVEHPAAEGSLSAFARPAPVTQASLSDLRGRVRRDEFAGQTALVVGGSRGLGELTAKLLTAGGARVTISFARGREDAVALVAEAQLAGLEMRTVQHDVTSTTVRLDPQPRAFDHLYYFASPKITSNIAGGFDARKFAAMMDVYVLGAARTAEWFHEQAPSVSVFWAPSTAFLEDETTTFPEYVAAKACAEALFDRLGRTLPKTRFVSERLPKLETDQTRALIAEEFPDSTEVMLSALRKLV